MGKQINGSEVLELTPKQEQPVNQQSQANEFCCGDKMLKIFRGEGGAFRGWYCSVCGNYHAPIGRENKWRLINE